MWTFTTDGFFSVVAHQKKHTHLMVRARDKESLENLAYKLSRTTDVLPVYKSERKADLQYTNFKNACRDAEFDEAKLIAMHRVWETMAYDWDDLRQYLVSIDHPDD